MRVSVVIPARPADRARAERLARCCIQLGAYEAIVSLVGGGCAHGRNLGAHRATGDVLLFLDADVGIGGSLKLPEGPSVWTPRFIDRTGDPHTKRELALDNFLNGSEIYPRIIVGSVAIKTTTFAALGEWDTGAVLEDVELGGKIRDLRIPVGRAPLYVFVYRKLIPVTVNPAGHASSYGRVLPPSGPIVVYRRTEASNTVAVPIVP